MRVGVILELQGCRLKLHSIFSEVLGPNLTRKLLLTSGSNSHKRSDDHCVSEAVLSLQWSKMAYKKGECFKQIWQTHNIVATVIGIIITNNKSSSKTIWKETFSVTRHAVIYNPLSASPTK